MKTRTQKLISLVLVLVMLVTMIPAGIFSANAAVTAELQTALDNKATELVIYSAEDWNAVAAAHTSYLGTQSQTFIGVTIKLGADIDAEGAALNSFAPAGTAFYGTFDGQGYTVSNVTVEGAANTGLIACALGGGKITNVNFDNITLSTTAGNIGLVAGQNSIWADLEISNINATNITITNNGTGVTGGLIGNHPNNGFTQVVKNVNFQGTVNAPAGGTAGGFLGAGSIGGVTQWSNLYIDVDVVTNKTTPVTNLGGFAGTYGVNSGKKIEISNVYLTGSVTDENKSDSQHGGFIGVISGVSGQNVSTNDTTGELLLHDIVLANDLSKMCGNSTVMGSMGSGGNLQFENIYSITQSTKGTWSGSTQRWTWLSNNGAVQFNGINQTWASADATFDTISYVSSAIAAAMVVRDADGYLSAIKMPTGLALDLLNYDSTSTFVINSASEWEMAAASGKNFSGKTVKLGADIDANGAILSTLIPASVGNTSIVLDGQGYAIKNVGTAEAPQTEPLVAGKFNPGTVKNLTFQNVTMVGADATYGSGLIADWLNGRGTATVSNVKVLGCSIKDTAGSAAALFGRTINNGDAGVDYVNISDVIIDAATTIEAATYAGGVIGYVSGNGGIYNIDRVYTEATMKAPSANGYVGGLIGYAVGHTSYTSQFNFTNNVVKSALISIDGSGWTGRAGAICGRGTNTVDMNVYNCIMAPSQLPGGLVLRQAVCAANGSQDFDIQNCYINNMFMSVFYAESSSTLNGTSFSGHMYSAPGALSIGADAEKVETLYTTDANGFIVNVKDHIDAEGIQIGEVDATTNKYAIRFIAYSQLAEATDVNMVIMAYVKDANGNVTQTRKFDSAKCTTGDVGCKLYDYLTAHSANGVKEQISAESRGVEKLAGFTIYNIPTGSAITFEVTTSYVDANGITVTGANVMTVNFDANGALIK